MTLAQFYRSRHLPGLQPSSPRRTEDLWVAGNFDHFDGYRRQGLALIFAEDALVLEEIQVQEKGVRLRGVTVPGRSYHLQACEVLSRTGWHDLQVLVGDGSAKVFEDLDRSNQQRFYRVQVVY